MSGIGVGTASIFFTCCLGASLLQSAEVPVEDFEGEEMRFSFFGGDEFPGAKGTLARVKAGEGEGDGWAGRLDADFRGGGVYVQMGLDLEEPVDIQELRFRIKTAQVNRVRLRLSDATGQVHQQLLPAPAGGGWQDVKVTEWTGGEEAMHWGGADDGKWHGPATGIAFLLEKDQLRGPAGTLWLDAVRVQGRVRPRLRLDVAPEMPGNVFLEGEPVRIPLRTTAREVTWKLRDWRGALVDGGAGESREGRVVVEPRELAPGHFTLEAEAVLEEQRQTIRSSLAKLPVLDLSRVSESPFGVCTHFAQGWDVKLAPLIARAGIKLVRDELYWDSVEEEKGQFDVPGHFREYLAALKAHHLAPLIPLTFENPHYDGGNTPHTAAGFAAYARYGAEMLRQFPEIGAVEIWNEYNGSFCKGPAEENRSATYAAMLKAAYPQMQRERPGVRVAGAGTAGVPWPYLEKLFQTGALAHMDVVSVHPYRYRNTPEGMETEMEALAALVRQHAGGHSLPVWATEYGWAVQPAEAEGDLAITELDQAKFLVRGHTLLLAGGAEKAFWYLFRDSPDFPTMGLVRGDEDAQGRHTPKPAYTAYATLIRQLQGARFVAREKAGPGIYVLRFEAPGGPPVRVMWAVRECRLALQVPEGEAVRQTDLMGASTVLKPGELVLHLTDEPVYLRGEVKGLPVPGAAHEESEAKTIADSGSGFSAEQGRAGWSYGFDDPAAPGPDRFRPLAQYRVTDWTREWVNEIDWLSISATYQHPSGRDGKGVPVVRRWRGAVAGPARLRLEANLESTQGDGVTLRVRQDGREILTRKLGGGAPIRCAESMDLDLQPGGVVDFVVDPGPASQFDYDGTSLHARIFPRS